MLSHCWPSSWFVTPSRGSLSFFRITSQSVQRHECSGVSVTWVWVQWLERGSVNAAHIEGYCVNAKIAITWTWLSKCCAIVLACDCVGAHVLAKMFFTNVEALRTSVKNSSNCYVNIAVPPLPKIPLYKFHLYANAAPSVGTEKSIPWKNPFSEFFKILRRFRPNQTAHQMMPSIGIPVENHSGSIFQSTQGQPGQKRLGKDCELIPQFYLIL